MFGNKIINTKIIRSLLLYLSTIFKGYFYKTLFIPIIHSTFCGFYENFYFLKNQWAYLDYSFINRDIF